MPTDSRLLRWAHIAVFAACLVAPLALYVAGGRSEPVDNRRPVERPALDAAGLLDTEVTGAFDAYFDDAFPLRDEAIELDSRLDRALGDSSNPDVVLGRGGWLFLRSSIDQPCRTPAEIAALVEALERADRLVAATGRSLVNVIAPDKASIFPDRLADEPTCVLANAEQLSTLDTSATVVMALEETRVVAAADDRAYRRLDTHWTARGATPTAAAVIELLAPGTWRDDAIVPAEPIDSVGDLSVLLGLGESEPEVRARSHPGPEPATTAQRPYVDRDGAIVEWIDIADSSTAWSGAIGGRTVLLHDSFGDRVADLVGDYFAAVTTVGDPSPRRSGRSIRAADRIVRIEVQRLFAPTVVDTDLAAEFAVALEAELSPRAVDGDCATGCVVGGGGERYLIARLRDSEARASIGLGDRRFELDALTTAAGWFVDGDAPLTLTGDVDRVVVSAVAVP